MGLTKAKMERLQVEYRKLVSGEEVGIENGIFPWKANIAENSNIPGCVLLSICLSFTFLYDFITF